MEKEWGKEVLDHLSWYKAEVVNAKGELSGEFAFGGAGAQQKLLEADGIEVLNGRVDLDRYGWKGSSH